MPVVGRIGRIATLWSLAWRDQTLECGIYRTAAGFELTVESAHAVIVSEPFELQPRAIARAQTLRDALGRRGWTEVDGG